MRNITRTWVRLSAILAAATMAVALGGCASPQDSAGQQAGGSSSSVPPGTVDSPEGQTPGGDSDESSLVGLDHAEVLSIGIEGGAAITCGYTFDAAELEPMRLMADGGWVSPEATIHLDGPSAHWEVPQAGNRLSHILYYENATYMWKVPGDGGGVMAVGTGDEDLTVLEGQLRKNAHDCAAFAGPASMFQVPNNIEFVQP